MFQGSPHKLLTLSMLCVGCTEILYSRHQFSPQLDMPDWLLWSSSWKKPVGIKEVDTRHFFLENATCYSQPSYLHMDSSSIYCNSLTFFSLTPGTMQGLKSLLSFFIYLIIWHGLRQLKFDPAFQFYEGTKNWKKYREFINPQSNRKYAHNIVQLQWKLFFLKQRMLPCVVWNPGTRAIKEVKLTTN